MRIVARTSATAASSATFPRAFRRPSSVSTSTGGIASRLGLCAVEGWTAGLPFIPARASSSAGSTRPECSAWVRVLAFSSTTAELAWAWGWVRACTAAASADLCCASTAASRDSDETGAATVGVVGMVGAGAAGFAAGAAVIAAGAGGTGRGVAGVEGVAATRAGRGGVGIASPCAAATLAEDAQRRVEVLKRLKRAREAPDRVDVAVFPDELAVGRLCLTQVPADKQVRRRLARQTMVARHPRLAEPSAAFGERLRELAG